MSDVKPWHDCPPCPECKMPGGSPVGWSEHDAHIGSFEDGHNLFCPACGHSWRSTWREDRQAIRALMAWAAETWPRRDPRIAPREGDWLRRDGFEVRIDRVADGRVYFARFAEAKDGASALAIAMAQLPIEEFQRLAVGAEALSVVRETGR